MEYKSILYSRLISSFLWTVAFHIFPLSLYISLSNFDVHPIKWLLNAASVIFNIGTWISLMPIHCIVFGIAYISAQELNKLQVVTTSRFQFFCSCFSKVNALKCLLYFLLGIVVPWTYLNLNSETLILESQETSLKLHVNKKSEFLITFGVWTSMYYFIRFDVLSEKHLHFPIIRQLKVLEIRYKFAKVCYNCIVSSFVPTFYFLPFYLYYEKQISLIFESVLCTSESHSSDNIQSFLNFSFIFNAWLVSTVFFLIVRTLKLMIEIHYTEHYSFALIKQPNSNLVVLPTALGEFSLPLIRYLACYDLFIISTVQKSNRWQIFSLSQPGGHPHTWNAILHESLKIAEEFISDIDSICKIPEPVKPVSPVPKHIHMRDMPVRHDEIFTGPIPQSPSNKLRNLVDCPSKSPSSMSNRTTVDELWTKLNSVVVAIQQNGIIQYIFGKKPDADIRFLLSNSQPLIWIVQSIAELSATALLEDQFGIVLKDLPQIINTLLRLKFSLDKLGNIQHKFQKPDHEVGMKASLKSALKRSLYRLAITYSEYLTDLPLSHENLMCMQNFVNFKEC